MADLDDFFAKKDRKRNKQAKKLAQVDEPKKPDEPRREKPAEDQQQPATAQDEDEWREAEVAKKADYSGLKIQHLTPEQENSAGIEGTNGTTINTSNEQKIKGPWNRLQEQVEPVKVEEKEPTNPSDVILPTPPAPSNVYVAPLLRNRPPGSSMDGPPRVNRFGKPQAPDINNEEFFPVLGESRKGHHHHHGPGGGGQWSEARSGVPPSSRMPPPQVSLGNRFTSLTHDS